MRFSAGQNLNVSLLKGGHPTTRLFFAIDGYRYELYFLAE